MIGRTGRHRSEPAEPSWDTAGSDTVDTRVWRLRAAGALVAVTAAWYLPWALASVNLEAWWLSLPFVVASLALVATALLSWINNWQRAAAAAEEIEVGHEPFVAVIVPTAGEPVAMVRRTVESVLGQDWPHRRLCIAVGDDSRRAEISAMVAEVARLHRDAHVFAYHPPRRGDERRRGDAKSGNLNAGLDALAVRGIVPDVIETRDADDEVGHARFLRRAVAPLVADARTAYVQTIKEAFVSPHDPFGNLEPMFYRGTLAARHAANAVFPCGSGLVWSRVAIEDIGQFPTWNLVEDLQSGVEALRRGWRSAFVPVVGAVGQTAPEDLANMVKQRGTWALDTVRLLVWSNLRGLTVRQRLQFLELLAFYTQGIATLVFLVVPAVGLLTDTYPLVSNSASYALHFWPVTVAIELFLLALNANGRWELIFRARQMWVGLAVVFAVSVVRAVTYGPRRKPVYKVTRKTHVHRWYWKETLPQLALVVLLATACSYAVMTRPVLTALDLGSLYWCGVGLLFLTTFLRKSWFGVGAARRAARRVTPAVAPVSAVVASQQPASMPVGREPADRDAVPVLVGQVGS